MKFCIDPNFVAPEPTPADRFCKFSDDTTTESQEFRETMAGWREDGVQMLRITITGPKAVDDKTGYPPGLWIEGWLDKHAQMLPFGAGYPDENSPCYPPLTMAEA